MLRNAIRRYLEMHIVIYIGSFRAVLALWQTITRSDAVNATSTWNAM